MKTTSLLEGLANAARAAGDAIMHVYQSDVKTAVKHDGSPVTEADHRAEAIIRPVLGHLAPDIHVVSEENTDSHVAAPPERFFLVDPLDGTKEFVKRDGHGAFTVNIALIERGLPVLGVVYAPALDRLFSGGTGLGATEISGRAHRRISIRPCPSSGPIAVASRSHPEQQTERWLADNAISNTRSIGSSLKFCLLACGECDVYPRFSPTMEWDTAAGDAVLRAAGGRVTTPDDEPFVYGKPDYRNGPFIARGGWSRDPQPALQRRQ